MGGAGSARKVNTIEGGRKVGRCAVRSNCSMWYRTVKQSQKLALYYCRQNTQSNRPLMDWIGTDDGG
jgi:hypothetical protein